MNGPETRPSLLLQLRDPAHDEAWEEFAQIYRPLIYRLARRKGFQHADANDVCQEVLATVGRSINRFEPDTDKGSFRGWLFRIARNLMINFLARDRSIKGSGDSSIAMLLAEQADERSESASHFDLEYKREVFVWAAEKVQPSFAPATWQAFWMTSVDGKSVQDVANELGKTVGSVRVARCRVFSRLKQEVKRFPNLPRSQS